MGSSTKRFETEKVSRLLVAFALPIILELLIFELYSMVDTFFVGRFVNESAIASLMVVFPIQRFYGALAILVGVGASTMLSRSIGGHREEHSKNIMRNGFALMILLTLPIAIVSFVMPERVLTVFGADQGIMTDAVAYLKYISAGAFFLGLTTYMAYILLSLGDTTVSVVATAMGAVLNIVLNSICIFIFHMGVAGAGMGSLLSQMAGFIYAMMKFRKHAKTIDFKIKGKWMPQLNWMMILGGLSAFIIEVEDSFVITALNRILSSSMGSSGIVILGLVMKVYMFIFIALFGIVSAMQPIAAYYLGAHRKDKLQELMDRTLIYGFLSTLIIWAIFQIFPKQLVGYSFMTRRLFKKRRRALRIVVSVFPVVTVYYMGIFYFQAREMRGFLWWHPCFVRLSF